MSLIGNNNEEKIWNYLKEKIGNDYGVAGVMGNLKAKSNLNPKNLQNSFEKKLTYNDETYTAAIDSGEYAGFITDKAGYGLAQWTYWSRKQNLLNFAKSQRKSIGDLEMQLDFFYFEISKQYAPILQALKTATSVKEASNVILLQYERLADQSEGVQNKRAEYSQVYYNKYHKEEIQMARVALDAGHGSNTAGKRTPDGYREHWIDVRCAAFCEEALVRCGIEVFKCAWDDADYTDDPDVALATRQAQIKAAGCQASVSIHANASGDGKTYNSGQGVETFYHSNPNNALDSARLATAIQSYLIQGTTQKNRGVKTANFAMCNAKKMGVPAAALVEMAFMTNEREAELMKTDTFLIEVAEEIAHGICDYLGVQYIPRGAEITPAPAPTPVKPEEEEKSKFPYKVKITANVLNVRKGPGTNYSIVTSVRKNQVYTIMDEDNGWGLLKSYAKNRNGWICLKYTTKL